MIRNTIKLLIITMTMAIYNIEATGCSGNNHIVSVPAPVFEKEIKSDSIQLLDVRTPEEYAEGHISGALNINVQSDDFQINVEKELSKDSTILVYCRSGKRSMNAAEKLSKLGYKVINLTGGIIEWQENDLPVVKSKTSTN